MFLNSATNSGSDDPGTNVSYIVFGTDSSNNNTDPYTMYIDKVEIDTGDYIDTP